MLARSMPTGAAIDHVAKRLGVKLFVVPTGIASTLYAAQSQ